MLIVVKDVKICNRPFVKCKMMDEFIYVQDKLNDIDIEYMQDGLNRFKQTPWNNVILKEGKGIGYPFRSRTGKVFQVEMLDGKFTLTLNAYN